MYINEMINNQEQFDLIRAFDYNPTPNFQSIILINKQGKLRDGNQFIVHCLVDKYVLSYDFMKIWGLYKKQFCLLHIILSSITYSLKSLSSDTFVYLSYLSFYLINHSVLLFQFYIKIIIANINFSRLKLSDLLQFTVKYCQ